jgi:hypothetical protein
MVRIRGRRRIETWWGRGIVLGAVMLILGISLCLFDGDGDHHDDQVAPDLCLGMITASVVAAALAGPLVSGWVWPEPRWLVHTVSSHLPDPPPKSTLRS